MSKEKKVGFWEKHSHKKGFAILFLLFFAPIGIWLSFKHKHFTKKTRYIVSAIALIWFSFIVYEGQPTEEEKAEEEAKQEQTEKEREEKKQAKKEEKEQAKKEKEEAEKEKKKKEEEEKPQSVNDMVEKVKDGSDVSEVLKQHGKEIDNVEIVDLGEVGGNTLQMSKNEDLAWSENSFMKLARQMFDNLEVAFADESIDSVQVYAQTEFNDATGKTKTQNAFSYTYSREDFEELELDNFITMSYGEEWRIFQQSDNYSVHPAIYQGLKDKYKENLSQ